MTTGSTAGKQSMGAIAPKLAELTDSVLFDDVWQRLSLSPRDRSMVTVSVLVALHRLVQIPYHPKRALENGVTHD